MNELVEQPEPNIETIEKAQKQAVLVVDDDIDQNDLLCHRLKGQGFHAISALSGRQAVEMAKEHRPTLILLDVGLPDIDGLEVCRQLADDAQTCGIPIIVITGMPRENIVRQARSAGGTFFLGKPFDPNALLILIQQAIDQSELW